jgi:multicomponent Na+:H+ antiporter subunit C
MFENPLPHVLMLTAIVVGLATFALGLSILLKIQQNQEIQIDLNKKSIKNEKN